MKPQTEMIIEEARTALLSLQDSELNQLYQILLPLMQSNRRRQYFTAGWNKGHQSAREKLTTMAQNQFLDLEQTEVYDAIVGDSEIPTIDHTWPHLNRIKVITKIVHRDPCNVIIGRIAAYLEEKKRQNLERIAREEEAYREYNIRRQEEEAHRRKGAEERRTARARLKTGEIHQLQTFGGHTLTLQEDHIYCRRCQKTWKATPDWILQCDGPPIPVAPKIDYRYKKTIMDAYGLNEYWMQRIGPPDKTVKNLRGRGKAYLYDVKRVEAFITENQAEYDAYQEQCQKIAKILRFVALRW